jgi:mono/diheme cytochrome c family protein
LFRPRPLKEALRVFSGIPGIIARRLTLALAFSFVVLVSGCDAEGYPAELKYPKRTEIIVNSDKLRDEEVFTPDAPGKLDESLRQYYTKCGEDKKGEAFDPALLSPKESSEIAASLEKHFGTPAKPMVKIDKTSEEDVNTSFEEALKNLQLDDKALAAGSVLYRRHCLHCHGVPGNGRGPTATWLHPHPRDYRKGKFKFSSTGKDAPSRNDLYRVLKNGVDYTSMPSFGLLADTEIDHLISYVIHLSLRGQAEEATMTALLRKEPLQIDNGDVPTDAFIQDRVRYSVLQGRTGDDVAKGKGWAAANMMELTPIAAPSEGDKAKDDIAKGYKLFISDDAGCLKCHKDFGRSSLYRYDFWGTLVQPRNLTAGVYRGGRRPIDFYWRLKNGIKPSTMPALEELLTHAEKALVMAEADEAKQKKMKADFTEANIWRLIAFIQAVPYPAMLPDAVRKEVYPPLIERVAKTD